MRAFWSAKNAMAVDKVTVKPEQNAFTVDTKIMDVITDSVFGDYGRLLFPADRGYYSGDTLGKLSLTWYGNINPKRTVEIVNYIKWKAAAGETVFYDIYSVKEKAHNLDKKNTGLFFFRGNKGAKTAIVNAGGGFVFVGTNDGIASFRTMKNRIDRIKANGTDAVIEIFHGLSHGFGLGEGTVAEGWIDRAVDFWERQM